MPRIAVLLTTLIWGATFPATKAALEQIPPLTFLFLRFALGAVMAIALARLAGLRLTATPAVVRMSVIASVWLCLGYICQTVGLRYTSASNSAFITVLYVVFVPLFLWRLGLGTMVATVLALVGLWLLVKPSSASMNVGDLLTLLCAAAFAAHIVCLERFTKAGESTSIFLGQLFITTAVMAVMMLWEQPPASAFTPSTSALVGLFVTGVLATGAFAVQMWAQRVVPAQQVALIFALEPALAAWLAWLFLGEVLDMQGWIGSGCIFVATMIGALASTEAASAPPERERSVAA
ncbi:MAG: DMT family transporter [Nitrospiraceae bacterium]